MGKKCPLRTTVLAVDEKEKAIKSSRGRAQSWWRPSRAWEARVKCLWHSKVAWKYTKNNNKMKNKNEWTTTTNITKTSLEVLPSKVTSLGVFVFQLKKNDYRSVIDITIISNIVLHMVTISTFNKDNGWCWRHIKWWWFF